MNCLHTGGAVGVDQYFEKIAKNKHHNIVLYHFDGHKNTRLEKMNSPEYKGSHELLEVTHADMDMCTMVLEKAASKLGRQLPQNNAARHLLERDYHLVSRSGAETLFVIGSWEDRTRGIIKGGTGWIVQIFIILNPRLPVYFHCRDTGIHYKLSGESWLPIEKMPDPAGVWIGCGSRY